MRRIARQLLGLDPIIVQQGAVDVLAQRFGLGGHQIATHPVPDRLERHARDASEALVIGAIVNEERLDRCEEQPGGIADTWHWLSGDPDRAA
jgi:hypothetical protein